MLATDIIGYGHDGELLCEDCAREAGLDLEDDPKVWPVFAEGDHDPSGEYCSGCGEEIWEPEEIDERTFQALHVGEKKDWNVGDKVAVLVLDSVDACHRSGMAIVDEFDLVDRTFKADPWTEEVSQLIHDKLNYDDVLTGSVKLPTGATISWKVISER